MLSRLSPTKCGRTHSITMHISFTLTNTDGRWFNNDSGTVDMTAMRSRAHYMQAK